MANSANNMPIKRGKILIVDDSELNRSLLADILGGDYDIIEAENGIEACAYLQQNELEVSLMLLDIVMPQMDGFEVLAVMNKKGWIKSVPVIIISAEIGSASMDRAYDLGAVDYISRPFDERTVIHRVTSNFMLALNQKALSDRLLTQIYEHNRGNRIMIQILSHIVEFRNGDSGLHILHVSTFTEIILKHLVKITDKYNLSQSDIANICDASALHDIGKMSIPEEILNKPGRLTKEEFEIMKQHSSEGERLLRSIPYQSSIPLIDIACEICRWHHERYDGKGYPDGLKGDAIPISAQVVALADVYDALTSERVYKSAVSHEEAIKMILSGECGVFNPLILRCLRDVQETLKTELNVFSPLNYVDNGLLDIDNLFATSGPCVSNRTIQLLEHERMKNRFYANLSHEVLFEYVASPTMIELSEWGADYLGLPQKIRNPSSSTLATQIFQEGDFDRLMSKMLAASPENPIIEEKYLLTIQDTKRWNKVIVQTLWSTDESKPMLDGALGKIVDVDEETNKLQHLEQLAEHDAMTGLFNQHAAKRRITKLLADACGKKYMLVFLDLDNLKKANDIYGHLFGNKLIKQVAERMQKNTRSKDICARIGGDEFIIFMEYQNAREQQIKRIFDCITKPLGDFPVSISMGIALAENFRGTYDELFHMADLAAYSVKKSGKNSYKFYSEGEENNN